MLHEFLSSNREELISRCRVKVARRSSPKATDSELEYGIPVFMAQLIEILRSETPGSNAEGPSASWDTAQAATGMLKTAISHGNELMLSGCTVNQVVHDYGDLCQAVTELAIETNAMITNAEFQTLNRCLDNAIAGAVSAYERERDQIHGSSSMTDGGRTVFERQLHLINMAMVTMDAIKGGSVGLSGATAGILDRSLRFLQDLTADAITDACPSHQKETR